MDARMIAAVAQRLRSRRNDLVAVYGFAGLRSRVIDALDELALLWDDPAYNVRLDAQANSGTFPFSMVKVSLDALLRSLKCEPVRALIESEPFDPASAPELVGHIVAGNTPLIGWTTVIRALLVGSASLVKVPSSAEAVWLDYLMASLKDAAPEIAPLVEAMTWRGGNTSLDRALCQATDKVAVYGSDETIAAVEELAKPGSVVGYGHRVSGGIVLDGANLALAADGFATDILVYDQGGCLSPHTILVEGDYERTVLFGERLAAALAHSPYGAEAYPSPPGRSARVREARDLARLLDPVKIWADSALRWTVVASCAGMFQLSPTRGIVYLIPFARSEIARILTPVTGKLQGFGVGLPFGLPPPVRTQLVNHGVSYICSSGSMQAPPLSWRENGYDVLRSLLL